MAAKKTPKKLGPSKKQLAYERIIGVLDEEVDPRRMSRADYKELLGELSDDFLVRLETAEQEDKAEAGE